MGRMTKERKNCRVSIEKMLGVFDYPRKMVK